MKFTCKHCGQTKPAKDFEKDKRCSNGITNQCKACRCNERRENGHYTRERIRKYKKKAGDDVMLLTVEQIEKTLQIRNCTYCACELSDVNGTPTEATIDHIFSLNSDYGPGNFYLNITACCRSCNSSKGDDHVADFYRRSDKFTPELFRKFAGEFGGRMLKRELSEHEAAQMARNFIEEADMLQKNKADKSKEAL